MHHLFKLFTRTFAANAAGQRKNKQSADGVCSVCSLSKEEKPSACSVSGLASSPAVPIPDFHELERMIRRIKSGKRPAGFSEKVLEDEEACVIYRMLCNGSGLELRDAQRNRAACLAPDLVSRLSTGRTALC
ncbi:hypothetical protein KSP40_PGU009831 [Platanthera guangdongensis]|uniref:Uncharacterized protein n=1 Tax=Platanthera guangdongensis TaxID=2320717 RepID=A0ABR2N2P2_9ASPA